MPRMIQLHVSWAESQEEAEEQAVREWPNGGMPFPKADIRNPEDFAAMARQVSVENFVNRVLMSADLDEHLEHIQHYVDLGFDEVYVHNVGAQPGGVQQGLRRACHPEAPLAGRAVSPWAGGTAVTSASCSSPSGRRCGGRTPSCGCLCWRWRRRPRSYSWSTWSCSCTRCRRWCWGGGSSVAWVSAQWVALFVIGWGGSAIATLLFTTAFAVGNPTVVILLQKTQPLFAIALAGLLLRERLGWAYWPCFVVAMVGAYMISFGDLGPFGALGSAELLTAALALGAAILWGSSTVLGRLVLRDMPFHALTGARLLLAAPLLAAIVVVQGSVAGIGASLRRGARRGSCCWP